MIIRNRFINAARLHCTMMDLIARQVVRPSDLLGKDKTSPNSASRDAIVVDGYRSYENVEINGSSTSELQ